MFGLTLLQPAFLLAGLAAGVPILIHLINRHRALVHRFPALRFLLMADRRTARKFRLYQLLLLALRVLAILLLALLLSQPRWGGEASAALAQPAQATVVLLDNSLSMQFRDGQETRLERAKTLAGQMLEGIAAPDSAVVLPLVSDDPDAEPPLPGANMAALWDQMRVISVSHEAVDVTAAVQRAVEILQASTAPRRRLVLLTDLTVHGWEGFRASDLPRLPEDLVVHVIRLGSPERDANALISDVRVTEPPFIEQTPLDVTVWVRNRSDEPVRSLRVDLLLGGETVGQQLTDLSADEEVAVPFRIVAPEAGLHWGEVRLQGDAFAEDDRFYVALQTVSPARVLVVDGDPGTSLFDSETFYLFSALQPRGSLGPPLFHPKPLVWEGLEQERLSDYSVIVLCNVEALSPQVRQGLHQFVTDGGGLIFFAGHQVAPTRYNALFYGSDTPLLPAALGEPVQQPRGRAGDVATGQRRARGAGGVRRRRRRHADAQPLLSLFLGGRRRGGGGGGVAVVRRRPAVPARTRPGPRARAAVHLHRRPRLDGPADADRLRAAGAQPGRLRRPAFPGGAAPAGVAARPDRGAPPGGAGRRQPHHPDAGRQGAAEPFLGSGGRRRGAGDGIHRAGHLPPRRQCRHGLPRRERDAGGVGFCQVAAARPAGALAAVVGTTGRRGGARRTGRRRALAGPRDRRHFAAVPGSGADGRERLRQPFVRRGIAIIRRLHKSHENKPVTSAKAGVRVSGGSGFPPSRE